SGTFGLESVIGSTVPSDGKLLVIVNGAYGDRIDRIAKVLKIDTATLMQRLRHVPPAHDFREAYGYTNLMFMVAGEVIASVSGQTWDAFVQSRLLDPLGMKRTSTTVRGLAEQDNVATAHAATPDGQAKVPYLDVDAVGAAAALNSSVNDMSKWVRMQLAQGTLDGTRVVPKEAIAESRVQHTPIRRRVPRHGPTTGYFAAYGLGWVLLDHFGRFVVTHGGGLPGMTSRVLLSPEDDLGVVVLTNSESGAASQIAQVVLARIVGEDTNALVAAAIAPRQAAASEDKVDKDANGVGVSLARPAKTYAGRFSNPLLGPVIVTNLDGKLSLDLAGHGGLMCELSPLRDDVFSCAWKDAVFGVSEVTFDVKRGRIKSLRFKVRPSFVDPLEYRFTRGRG
ncbi:MAG: serine hydrolase, partial [Nannocystaceae bacterium]|nr:serine hydrolase [Nannocystaceae bacterium]